MADLKQCETMIRGGSFMTLGPRPWVRCENKPHWIGTDKASGETQSLCDDCAKVAVKELAPDSYELDWITDGVKTAAATAKGPTP
jgi:hypothetical protein